MFPAFVPFLCLAMDLGPWTMILPGCVDKRLFVRMDLTWLVCAQWRLRALVCMAWLISDVYDVAPLLDQELQNLALLPSEFIISDFSDHQSCQTSFRAKIQSSWF